MRKPDFGPHRLWELRSKHWSNSTKSGKSSLPIGRVVRIFPGNSAGNSDRVATIVATAISHDHGWTGGDSRGFAADCWEWHHDPETAADNAMDERVHEMTVAQSRQLIRLRGSLRWLALLASAIVLAPRAAFAHAHLVRSAPAANSHESAAPTRLQLWFSEAAEPGMTTLTVTAPNGALIPLGSVTADSGNSLLLTAPFIAALAPGTYTVAWRTVATDDGHPSNGKFSFVLDSGAGPAPPPAAGVVGTVPNIKDSSGHVQMGPSAAQIAAAALSVEAPSYVAARWLNFASLLLVIGVVAFRILVVPRVMPRSLERTSFPDRSAEGVLFSSLAVRRAAALGAIASVAVLVASVWRLFEERAAIGGGISLQAVLHSYWGQVWHVQAGAAILALVVFVIGSRLERGGGYGVWMLAAVAALVLGAVSAFSGHAIAVRQYRNMSVALDVLHVLTAGSWLGGLGALVAVGVPVALYIEGETGTTDQTPLLARVVNAFSPVALTCACIVVITGLLAAWMRLGSLSALFGSSYGKILLVKVAFVLLAVAGGAFNWKRMRAMLTKRGDSAARTFRRSAWFELVAAIIVIAVTAVLVATPPPVH